MGAKIVALNFNDGPPKVVIQGFARAVCASLRCDSRQGLLRLLLLVSVVDSGVLSMISCRGENTATGVGLVGPQQAYWALQVNQQALNFATSPPYNKFQLTATPVNAAGTPLVVQGRVIYKASDSTVTVDSTGLVTARFATQAGNPTHVTVSLQSRDQNVTDSVKVFIQVTDTVPQNRITTFSMQPAQGDSAKRSVDTWAGWPVHATDHAGTTVCDSIACPIVVSYTSSNPSVANFDPHTGLTLNGPGASDTGHTTLTAAAWYYGVPLRDSVNFKIGYMLYYQISLSLISVFGGLMLLIGAPRKLILGVGATVGFCAQDPRPANNIRPVDIVFDQPAAVDSFIDYHIPQLNALGFNACAVFASGQGGNVTNLGSNPDPTTNIPDSVVDAWACRTFSVPGTYLYHSTLVPSDTDTLVIKND